MGKDTRSGVSECPAHSAVSPLSVEDAALLVEAHEQLLADQASGVTVLGSTAGGEQVAAARRRLDGEAERRTEAALVSAERLAHRDAADELDVRRERRATARALRGAA